MRAPIVSSLFLLLLAPSVAFSMSWCSERELMFDSAAMCTAICPSACSEAEQKTGGSAGPCGPEYRGFVFSPSLNRTYAITAGSYGVDGLVSTPDYTSRGAIPNSPAENETAATLTRFYHTGVWIAAEALSSSYCGKTGRYYFDAATCEASCSGAGCVPAVDLATYNSVQPGRFFWRNGDPLAYANFAPGQPDNAATAGDITAGFRPVGEHWVEMGTDGTWADSGKHVADQVHARPVMVEFSGALECVNGETGSENPPGDQVCAKDANGDGTLSPEEFQLCASTSGGSLCPIDAVACVPGSHAVICPHGGSLDRERDVCFLDPSYRCPAGYLWEPTGRICAGPVICPLGGILNQQSDLCETLFNNGCPSGYTHDPVSGRCVMPPPCSSGVYAPERDRCETGGTPVCPPGWSFNTSLNRCETAPECRRGAYDSGNDSCTDGSTVCPLGDFPCLDSGAGPMCSPFTCSDTEDEDGDGGSYQDDGERDENGRCLGQIYIFNGRPGECKEPGVSTTWFQCCSTDEGSFLFIEKICGTGDKLTSSAIKAKRTHFVGSYCKKRFPLIGCVQSAQVHCIFETKLGRIVQEQGRKQLENFQGPFGTWWGTPELPECRGFTPEEFQFLDFGKMDLSEFFADLRAKAASAIRGELKEKIDEFYDNTIR